MATPVDAFNTTKLFIRLGDGGSPEDFHHPCMINTARGIVFSSNPTETLLPFCPPDQDLPGWVEREPDAFTATITGAGIFDKSTHSIFQDWWDSGDSIDLQVALDDMGYYHGRAILSSFTITGAGRREKVTFDCTILSDGEWAWRASTT